MATDSLQAPESRHAIGTALPLPFTVSMRRGHLVLHTVIFVAGFATLLSRLDQQRHAFPAYWVILICVASAVMLAMTRIVILQHDGVLMRRVWPTKRLIPYGRLSEIEARGRTLRLTLDDGSIVQFAVTLTKEHRAMVVRWLQGQARAAAFD